jgi:hypothetical protein
MNKWTKTGLRIWIAITSVVGMLLGWVTLAHAGKPAPLFPQSAQAAQAQSIQIPDLQPVPSLQELRKNSAPAANVPIFQFSFPVMRTGGS